MEMLDLKYIVTMCVIKKKDISEVVMFKKYIPIQEKLALIDEYIKSLECYEKGIGYIDSFEQYFKFTMMAVRAYTNIKIDITYEEYDLLVKNGLLNLIFEQVQNDYVDFKDIMQMKLSDYLRINMV